MVSDSATVCGFVPMRGTAEKGERHVRLADDVILELEADDLPDSAALAQALTYPGYEQWTGLQVRHDEPAEHHDRGTIAYLGARTHARGSERTGRHRARTRCQGTRSPDQRPLLRR
jgi:hypothetical protein